ncbi:MAG: hypothetical protein V3T80_03085 [Kiloniellales bacterium]
MRQFAMKTLGRIRPLSAARRWRWTPEARPLEVEPEFDLERVVWDPEYRDEVRAQLRQSGLS